ncbi:MAG: ribose 5-phosphate isomerase A [Chloroflexi bacterium]|nr:MAG: ribose 5-phosphate isomerase A [Chloroflexota bacterium]
MSKTIEELKREAGEKAAEYVVSGMVVGLGTGSTAVHAVRALGRMLANGRLQNVVGIPTSEETRREAERVGIPLTNFNETQVIDLTIDGADEIAPNFDLIKGLGSALLREKIVATASKEMIVVSDERKLVNKLGTRAPVPVEVIPFAQQPVAIYLQSLGARPVLRLDKETGQKPVITDENNIILDCWFDGGLDNPLEMGQAMRSQPGVVEHGLFFNLATRAVVATSDGIQILERT